MDSAILNSATILATAVIGAAVTITTTWMTLRSKTIAAQAEPIQKPESAEAPNPPAPTSTLQWHLKIGRILVFILSAFSVWCGAGLLPFFVVFIVKGGDVDLSPEGPRNIAIFSILFIIATTISIWANKSLKLLSQSALTRRDGP
jgi:hypothetical protein